MTNSNFRNWLRIIWLENCREHEDHNELPYTLQEYWQRYRWWLRREYRFQNKNKRALARFLLTEQLRSVKIIMR